ncbi:MAG: hypothetical protein ABL904_21060 [Hyphomicrobiaceae bacterium]
MLGRIIALIIGFIATVFLVTLAVANRHAVRLVLDPFNPENPSVHIDVIPLYAYLLGMLIAGVILGGFATWVGQSKWRRTARGRTQDSIRWQAEAERLAREREAAATGGGKQLAIARGR